MLKNAHWPTGYKLVIDDMYIYTSVPRNHACGHVLQIGTTDDTFMATKQSKHKYQCFLYLFLNHPD